MQLLMAQSLKTPAQSLVSAIQPQTSDLQASISSQRPKLRMIWHKEFDGKRERMIARWVMES